MLMRGVTRPPSIAKTAINSEQCVNVLSYRHLPSMFHLYGALWQALLHTSSIEQYTEKNAPVSRLAQLEDRATPTTFIARFPMLS